VTPGRRGGAPAASGSVARPKRSVILLVLSGTLDGYPWIATDQRVAVEPTAGPETGRRSDDVHVEDVGDPGDVEVRVRDGQTLVEGPCRPGDVGVTGCERVPPAARRATVAVPSTTVSHPSAPSRASKSAGPDLNTSPWYTSNSTSGTVTARSSRCNDREIFCDLRDIGE